MAWLVSMHGLITRLNAMRGIISETFGYIARDSAVLCSISLCFVSEVMCR
jgi:hypothetical protein